MAVTTTNATLTGVDDGADATTLANVDASDKRGRTIHVYNGSGGTIYLGGSTVDSATGYPLANSSAIDFTIETDTLLYGAIAGDSTTTVGGVSVIVV